MLAVAILSAVILSVESASAKYDCAYPIKVGNQADCIYPGKVGNQADYYWRDYFGEIPKDALPGGYNAAGNVTYVAQTAHGSINGLFPGNIYPGKKEGFTCPGSKFADTSNVKILCFNPHYRYEWLPVTADELPLLTDYQWVVGGSQTSVTLYIGRANLEGEVQVGRVYGFNSPYKGLWICTKAGAQMHFPSFELLVLAR